ncbi:hydantoinase B/oxoprolinase family protein [Rhodoligotrophos ferricapiens]|uniref:hydantoinase B/oxoprolinase family protein n=1 Tax=Rhodoligotrophos ferricapiens TaxID=3069264 RepID=UPI00315D686D
MSEIDPVTLAVIKGGLDQIAEEMDAVIAASAISPVIADAWDRASGIYDGVTGEVIVQGTTGILLFTTVMQHTVQEVIKRHDPASMKPGDVYVINDPYMGGTHTMDVKFVRPYFHDGKVVFFLANTGHWPDVGGMTPGGFTPVATEIYQEGLRLPPVKIYDGGELNQGLLEVMLLNMRVSEDRYGDMAAQINALDIGVKRLDELIAMHGKDTVLGATVELKRRSEALMRSHIESIPDGTYHFSDVLDSDGVEEGELLIDLVMTVKGSEITFDLSGSSKACRGPFNSPISCTVTGLMIAMNHVFWDVPINSGCFVPFHIIVPRGSMLNPEPPSSCSGCTTETTQRLIGVVMGALAQAIPDKVPACAFGTGTNIGIGGLSPSRGRYATVFFFGGGYGGHGDGDGLTNGSTLVSSSRNSSLEVLEQTVPILFSRYEVREGSAGDGQFRGGLGVEVAFTLRDGEATITLVGDRGARGPYGLQGGEAGLPARHTFYAAGEAITPAHLTKIDRFRVKAGDGAHLRTPGGGGWGDPAKRDRNARETDKRNGYC